MQHEAGKGGEGEGRHETEAEAEAGTDLRHWALGQRQGGERLIGNATDDTFSDWRRSATSLLR